MEKMKHSYMAVYNFDESEMSIRAPVWIRGSQPTPEEIIDFYKVADAVGIVLLVT